MAGNRGSYILVGCSYRASRGAITDMTTKPQDIPLPQQLAYLKTKEGRPVKNFKLIMGLISKIEAMADEIAFRRNEQNPGEKPFSRNEVIADYYADEEGFYTDD